MSEIELLFLSKDDVESLDLSLSEVMDAIETGLVAHGQKKVIMPSKSHLVLDFPNKLFNILKGYVEPVSAAGVKIIGDFHDNYQHNLPSEFALLNLYDPETGVPIAIVDATLNTWMRTGAVTALGAKYLASDSSRVLGHIGARGTSWYNVRMLDCCLILKRFVLPAAERSLGSGLPKSCPLNWVKKFASWAIPKTRLETQTSSSTLPDYWNMKFS